MKSMRPILKNAPSTLTFSSSIAKLPGTFDAVNRNTNVKLPQFAGSWCVQVLLHHKYWLRANAAGWEFSFTIDGDVHYTMSSEDFEAGEDFHLGLWIEKCFKNFGKVPKWALGFDGPTCHELTNYVKEEK